MECSRLALHKTNNCGNTGLRMSTDQRETGIQVISQRHLLMQETEDASMKLDALAEKAVSFEIEEQLKKYQEIDPTVLLKNDAKRYQDMFQLDQGLQFYLRQYLPFQATMALAQACKANLEIYKQGQSWQDKLKDGCKADIEHGESAEQRFRKHPEYRFDRYVPIDKIGRDYLKEKIGTENCDRRNIQKITNRELTFERFLEPPEHRLDKYLPIDQKGREYQKNVLGLDCGPLTLQKIMDGELTVQEAKELRENFKKEIEHALTNYNRPLKTEFEFQQFTFCQNAFCQKYVLDGSLTLEQARTIKTGDGHALACTGVQKYVDSGRLPIQQVLDLPFRKKYPLQYQGVQKCIDKYDLPIEIAINLPDQTCDALEHRVFHFYFEKNLLTIEKFLSIGPNGLVRLRDDSVLHSYIMNKNLTIDEVTNTAEYDCQDLCIMADIRSKGGDPANCVIS